MLLRMSSTGSAAMEPFLVGDSVAGETWAAEAAGRDLLGPGGKPRPAPARMCWANACGLVHRRGHRVSIICPAATSRTCWPSRSIPDPTSPTSATMDPAVLPDRAGSEHPEASFVGGTTDYSLLLRGSPVFHWFLLAALAFLLIEGVLFKSAPQIRLSP